MAGEVAEERDKILAGRRMYHVSMGVIEAALYGVPVAFFGRFALSGRIGPALTILFCLAVWAGVCVWVMRRANERSLRGRIGNAPSGVVSRMEATALRSAALASAVMLVFTVAPLLLFSVVPGLGVWLAPDGVWFFCFVILLSVALLYSLGRLSRPRLYPEYPGFTAAILFALAMLSFLFSYATG